MEQYPIQPRQYLKNIRSALQHFRVEWVYIRPMGSRGGDVIVSENVKNSKLGMSQTKNGLDIKIGGKKVFCYEIKKSDNIDFGNRWSVAYERVDNDGRIHVAHTGYPNCYESYTGPDDPNLPAVKHTILRSCNLKYLIEITFIGKISIKKICLVPQYKDWYYWEISVV